MFESPMAELLLVKPIHFVSLPSDPFPNTGRFITDAAGVRLNTGPLRLGLRVSGMRLKNGRLFGRICANNFER
jgi:hypothetical protein